MGFLPRLLLTLSLVGVGCTKQRAAEVEPSAVATVNGEALKKDDFERELSREAQGLEGVGPRTPEQMEPYKRALLDTLIERTLLLQAARSAQVTVSTEEVERRVLALAGEYPAGTFDDVLSQGLTSRQELQRTARERMVMEKLLNQEVYARLAVTEEDIRRAYAADGDAYSLPEKVHAAQIVVRGLDEAKRLAQSLREGKKFSDLARLYSESPANASRVRRSAFSAAAKPDQRHCAHRLRFSPFSSFREDAGAKARAQRGPRPH
jgi:peptidyl-prolyl cis-trans isomerase C